MASGDVMRDTLVVTGTKAVPLNALPEEAWTFLVGGGPDVDDLQDLYDNVPWLYRGVRIRAQAVANVPFAIMRGNEEIDRSDSYMNEVGWLPDPFTLLEEIEADLTVHAQAFLLKQRNVMGRPLEPGLQRLYPPTVRPKMDAERGITGFIRSIRGRQLPPYDPEDMVYIRQPDPWSEIGKARSSAEAAMASANVLKGVDDFAVSFFERGAVKVTLLTVSGSVSKDDRKELETWWEKVVAGVKNAFGAKVVNADRVKPEVIGEGLSELSDQELTKQKREDIATALGIPQSILFSTGGVNRAITQQDAVNFHALTVIPEARLIERTLNAQFFSEQGFQFKFKPQEMDIFQEDEERRSMALLNLVQAGETLENAYRILGFDLPEDVQPAEAKSNGQPPTVKDLEKWRRKALNSVKQNGGPDVPFESVYLQPSLVGSIRGQLSEVDDEEGVREVFDPLIWGNYP